MTYDVMFAPEAIEDLQELYDYLLSRVGERGATDYVATIYAYCLSFDTFPERGQARDDLRPGLRIVGYRRRATIAFQIANNSVTIARIFNRGLDFEAPRTPPSSSSPGSSRASAAA